MGYTENMIHFGTSGFCCVDEPQLPEIQKLDSIAERSFIFANNHWRGQAASTIRHLRMMLD